jgi:excinuclease UvrABC helicase subunit UvrB
MEAAAKELDFIMAAKFRDKIKYYKNKLEDIKL